MIRGGYINQNQTVVIMMGAEEKKIILVVDDTPQHIAQIDGLLCPEYQVNVALNGSEALEVARKMPQPDVILLDIFMPGMNGYEVCSHLKSEASTAHIPVIFVSGADSMEERLMGYDAGGIDYITKPIAAEELVRKVDLIIENVEKNSRFAAQADDAKSTAMLALANIGELGTVLHFFQRSFTCMSFDEVGLALIDASRAYNLDCVVQVRCGEGNLNFSHSGITNPIEIELFDRLLDTRVFDFKNRTVFNYHHLSLLVKNMPVNDEEQYGRTKDNMALLIEGADARVNALNAIAERDARQSNLREIVSMTEHALEDIETNHRKHKLSSTEIMDNLYDNLESSFLNLGLSEEQERDLIKLVSDAGAKMDQLYDLSMETDRHLLEVKGDLRQVLDQ